MRKFGLGAASLAALLLLANAVQSGEEKDLRAIIEKAVKAHGGDDKLAKLETVTMKSKGNYYGMGEGIPYTAEFAVQGPKQRRFTLSFSANGMEFKIVQVVNGDKSWEKLGDDVKELKGEELEEQKHALYASWVTSLRPLKEKEFKLSTLGEVKVEGKAAVGVRVSKKGQRDINLFFDKTEGMLVKLEHVVKDVKGGGDKELTEETFFSEYKDFGGAKQPTKIDIKREGKLYVDVVVTEISPQEKLEKSTFERP